MPIKLITRADDAGSMRSANVATAMAVKAGFIKNVSLMAPCAYIVEAVEMFCGLKQACYGLHATLNSEWDRLKWGPLSEEARDNRSGLVDGNGYFFRDMETFKDNKPAVETVLAEYDAQLDLLTRLGFEIVYVDSHMYEDYFIDGVVEAKREWAKRKGLISHNNYRYMPCSITLDRPYEEIAGAFKSLQSGQYVYPVHPAIYSDDYMICMSAEASSRIIRMRELEARTVSDPLFIKMMHDAGVTAVRYDEADIQEWKPIDW